MANQTLDYGRVHSFFTRSDAEDVDPNMMQLLVTEFITVQYFDVALLTVLVYHALTTLDKELLVLPIDLEIRPGNDLDIWIMQ
ncbi:uncharacterized protein FOMMEDRAFT_159164 [Fomitiporia mediterranea MF3/22]|uniref:uncharacterized protein n=1 Tax=Fomitiporia mediterranea (strain MF3/22) TaxID=694068 RepID=UPI00044086EC|nr:uncharacterized protein FOMMEDRAFT_159164 [Fomitiporia mediterranea MF3/22]EJD00469.1 hypothetical protein FOMMEDRAFT_159164 [Fomitiporia mediterranea MF3/22]